MEITTQEYARCTVVQPKGRLDAKTAGELEDALKAIHEKGQYRIVFDASQVEFMSSAALRVLVDIQKISRRYNRGQLVIADVSPQVSRTLELAGFYTLFKVYDTILDGVGNV